MALPIQQIPTISPQQQGLQNNIINQSQGLLNKATQGVDFDPIEQRARSQFNTRTVPSLAERFTSLGGGQRSSAFQGALGSASSDLEQGLAALRSQFGLQQQGQQNNLLSSLLGYGFQPGFENVSQPGWGSLFGQGVGQGIGSSIEYIPQLLQHLQQMRQQQDGGQSQQQPQIGQFQPSSQNQGQSGTRSGVNLLLKLLPILLGAAGGAVGGPGGAALGGAAGGALNSTFGS
jgi:hypothetical protein